MPSEEQAHAVDTLSTIDIANQRESTAVRDKESREPTRNAISRTDSYTSGLVHKFIGCLGSGKLLSRPLWCPTTHPPPG
jgi:glycerol kinase